MFEMMLGTFLKKPLDFLRNGKWGSADTSSGISFLTKYYLLMLSNR